VHLKTNYWQEKKTCWERHYDGTEEGCYTSYETTVTRSETIVEFDSSEERREYHALLLSLKPLAQRELTNISRAHEREEQREAEEQLKRCQAIYAAAALRWNNDLKRWHERHWLLRWLFPIPEAPREPALADWKKLARARTDSDNKRKLYARVLQTPERYELYLENVDPITYKAVLELKEFLEPQEAVG
jgi:hypothetical protein